MIFRKNEALEGGGGLLATVGGLLLKIRPDALAFPDVTKLIGVLEEVLLQKTPAFAAMSGATLDLQIRQYAFLPSLSDS